MPAHGLPALPPLDTTIPIKDRRPTRKIVEAIRLLTTGECTTQRAAAERAGVTAGYLCEAIRKPHVRVFIERRARETIASGMMRASARLNELVDAGSEHVSLDASKHLLAIAGIKPAADAQVSVNIDLKAGFVIDISEQPRVIEHRNALGQSVTEAPAHNDINGLGED